MPCSEEFIQMRQLQIESFFQYEQRHTQVNLEMRQQLTRGFTQNVAADAVDQRLAFGFITNVTELMNC